MKNDRMTGSFGSVEIDRVPPQSFPCRLVLPRPPTGQPMRTVSHPLQAKRKRKVNPACAECRINGAGQGYDGLKTFETFLLLRPWRHNVSHFTSPGIAIC